jgi:hypothetical protein
MMTTGSHESAQKVKKISNLWLILAFFRGLAHHSGAETVEKCPAQDEFS